MMEDFINFPCPRCSTKLVWAESGGVDCPECAKRSVSEPVAVNLDGAPLQNAPLGNKYVYFLWGDKNIKIGSTAYDPRKRAHSVQNQTKEKITLIGALLARESLELELHERFCRARVEGEWFYPCRGLLDLLVESFGHL